MAPDKLKLCDVVSSVVLVADIRNNISFLDSFDTSYGYSFVSVKHSSHHN